METFAENLRRRAVDLGLSNAEVARRVGLSERRYAHYVSGRNEPDLALLVRIADVLATTPNHLLGLSEAAAATPRALLVDRLLASAHRMTDSDLEVAVAQSEALVAVRGK